MSDVMWSGAIFTENGNKERPDAGPKLTAISFPFQQGSQVGMI